MATNSLASRLLKSAGKNSLGVMLEASNYGDKTVICQTSVPILNVMLGGDFDAGITCGMTQIVGDSRTFKTNIAVECVAAFLAHDPEAIAVFFDCEFGGMKAFKNRCTPDQLARIIHMPFENIEDLKFQMVKMLEDSTRGEKIIFFIDSISQVPSKKEVNNALEDNEAQDMTRAREMNSFFRMITPKLNIKNIPLFFINSYYADQTNKYAEPIIKGGKQNFLSSDNLWYVSRSQDKDLITKEIMGWFFNYSMMKSRFCREKVKMSIHVTYEGGINPLSGLTDLALAGGFLQMPTKGFYTFNPILGDVSDKKYRMKEIMENPKLFDIVLANKGFRDFVHDLYSLEAAGKGVRHPDFEEPVPPVTEPKAIAVVDLETGEIVR